ncbi:MAG: hypothetical protein ACTS85_05145 [Arsenophonus sp. NC-PG7-MAG3]
MPQQDPLSIINIYAEYVYFAKLGALLNQNDQQNLVVYFIIGSY